MTIEMWIGIGSLALSIFVLASTVGVNLQKRLVRIETILTGVDGKNGMAHDVRTVRQSVPDFDKRLTVVETRQEKMEESFNTVTAELTEALKKHLETKHGA